MKEPRLWGSLFRGAVWDYEAAKGTENVMDDPEPFVLQKACRFITSNTN